MKKTEGKKEEFSICTKIHCNPYNNSWDLGYWSKVMVLNEGAQFFKHIDCGYVFYILLGLHLPTMSSVRKLRPSMVW